MSPLRSSVQLTPKVNFKKVTAPDDGVADFEFGTRSPKDEGSELTSKVNFKSKFFFQKNLEAKISLKPKSQGKKK